jgi:hypothetical protein
MSLSSPNKLTNPSVLALRIKRRTPVHLHDRRHALALPPPNFILPRPLPPDVFLSSLLSLQGFLL